MSDLAGLGADSMVWGSGGGGPNLATGGANLTATPIPTDTTMNAQDAAWLSAPSFAAGDAAMAATSPGVKPGMPVTQTALPTPQRPQSPQAAATDATGAPAQPVPQQPQQSAAAGLGAQLDARIARGKQLLSNPLLRFFNPQGYVAGENLLTGLMTQRANLDNTLMTQRANQTMAANMGLPPSWIAANPAATPDLITAQALTGARSGNLAMALGLLQSNPKLAGQYAYDIYPAMAQNLSQIRGAVTQLDAAPNQAAYAAVRQSVLNNPAYAQALNNMGIMGESTVPKSYTDWQQMRGPLSMKLNAYETGVQEWQTQFQRANSYNYLPQKDAEAYQGMWASPSGTQWAGATARKLVNGQVVHVLQSPNSNDIQAFGVLGPHYWNNITPKFDEAQQNFIKSYAPQMEKLQGLADIKNILTQGEPDGKINTNPFLKQGFTEAFTALMREGKAGANASYSTLTHDEQGKLATYADTVMRNFSSMQKLMRDNPKATGADIAGATGLTQAQIREAMDLASKVKLGAAAPQLSTWAFNEGAAGRPFSLMPGVSDAMRGLLKPYWEQGRTASLQDLMQHSVAGADGHRLIPLAGFTNPSQGGSNVAQAGLTLPQTAPSATTPVPNQGNGSGSPSPAVPGPASPVAPTTPSGPSSQVNFAAARARLNGTPQAPARVAEETPTTPNAPAPTLQPASYYTDARFTQDQANQATINIESGGHPQSGPGRYQGLAQMSAAEMQRYGVTDPNNLQQVDAALTRKAVDEGNTLTHAGLPNTPANRYLVHQQGDGGAPALLNPRNSDLPAWMVIRHFYGSDAIAKRAIWGNLPASAKKQFGSVDNVTAQGFTQWWQRRYNRELARVSAGAQPQAPTFDPNTGYAMQPNGQEVMPSLPSPSGMLSGARAFADRYLMQGVPPGQRQAQSTAAIRTMASAAPVVGGAVGAAAGGPVGGAVGGVGGQALKDWVQGNSPTAGNYIRAAGFGAAGGIPGLGIASTLGRAAVAGATEGTASAVEGAGPETVALRAGVAAAGSALLEGFMRSLGRVGYNIASKFTPEAQQELMSASATLAKGMPVKPDVDSPTAQTNFENQMAEYKMAQALVKDRGINPDDAAHAYTVSTTGANRGQQALPGGAASPEDASAAVAQPLLQRAQQAQTNYDQFGAMIPPSAGAVRPNAPVLPQFSRYMPDTPRGSVVAAVTQDYAGVPAVMSAARRVDKAFDGSASGSLADQVNAVRGVRANILERARNTSDDFARQGLNETAAMAQRKLLSAVYMKLGSARGTAAVQTLLKANALFREVSQAVGQNGLTHMLMHGEIPSSLADTLANSVKLGKGGEQDALNAVAHLHSFNDPAFNEALGATYLRTFFKGAKSTESIAKAARDVLYGEHASVSRAILSPKQIEAVERVLRDPISVASKTGTDENADVRALRWLDTLGAFPVIGPVLKAINVMHMTGDITDFLRMRANGQAVTFADLLSRPAREVAGRAGAFAGAHASQVIGGPTAK